MLSWEMIKNKAKAENKYVFLDCYATWCGPCKEMDKNVFTKKRVGEFVNDKFISVRIQMDTSLRDNERIKKWYKDARQIRDEFKVFAYPTFLFLSPEGEIVHKDIGFKSESSFIALAEDAINPQKQYYKAIEDFKRGVRDTSKMKNLANLKRLERDTKLAEEIAASYISLIPKEKFVHISKLRFYGQVSKCSRS